MSNFTYHFLKGGNLGVDSVIAFNPESEQGLYQADSNNPHWQQIVEGLLSEDPEVWTYFDVKGGLATRLQSLSERVSYDGERILFDGDPQEGPLADHLQRCIESGVKEYEPVVKFWEKVSQNPDPRSREQLFSWLQSHEFTITAEGDILGYKGVVGANESEFRSAHSGTAFVDGEQINGYIPNRPGTTVTMPRSQVANNPDVACHYGLHVGDWSYASGFARGAVLEVHVNPRDVVSIPRDSGARKMRCCRYNVVRVREAQSGQPIEAAYGDEWAGDVGYSVDEDYYSEYSY